MYSGFSVHIRTPGLWLVTLTAEWIDTGSAGVRLIGIKETSGSRWIATEIKNGIIGVSTYHYLYALELFDAADVLQPFQSQTGGASTYFAPNNYGLAISCILMGG
jgi:hypothetical protein